MLATLFSIFLLTNPLIDTLLEHHLNTPEGRTEFLTEKLTPYIERANQLNQEIIELSSQITQASEWNAEILDLSEQVIQKMAVLNEMLPALNLALHIDSDFNQIDAIVESENLTEDQQKVADRIALLCNHVNQ